MSQQKKDEPTNKKDWWWHRRLMAYLGIFGLIGLAFCGIYFPVSEASASLLSYAGIGCCLLIIQYMGSSVCDIARAWKGTVDE